jgi:Uma2 family endonuclease
MHATTDQPRRHRLTVDDYYRMAEVGILDPEARTELIDGEIIDMGSPGSPHAGTVNYLNEVFVRAAEGRAIVLVPLCARHGIPEMWLVDLGGRRLTRHRAPRNGSYTLVDEPDVQTPLEVAALSGVVVDVHRLFG